MTPSPPKPSTDPSAPADPLAPADPWSRAAVFSVLALCGFQVWWGLSMRGEIRELRATAATLKEAADARARGAGGDPGNGDPGTGSTLEEVQALRSDFEILASDVARLVRKVDDLTLALENRGQVSREPEQPADLDWTQPDLFEAARKAADSVGIALTKDEVRVPARLVLREGALEYFAVLKGGKEHEAMFSITGNTLPDARRPKDLGVKLNNAIQALGFKRGKPIRFTPAGTRPATGEVIRIYVAWETGGKKELVRAEDLVWHRIEGRPMTPGAFVYVGSSFVPSETPGEMDFAADLTAEAIATYSAPNTMIDNTEKGAQDDTVFLAASPRIPDDVVHVELVFRREELAGAKEFPPPGTPK